MLIQIMATFICSKTRAFKAPGDPCNLPLNSKSLFHMKTYESATDSRSWAIASKERREYINELFIAETQPPPVSLQQNIVNLQDSTYSGKYICMNALVRTLMDNKDADIKYLQSQLALLEAFLDDLNLNDEQRSTFKNLKKKSIKCIRSPDSVFSNEMCCTELTPMEDIEETELEEQQKIIDEMAKRIEVQDKALERYKATTEDALSQISCLEDLGEELEYYKREYSKLHKSYNSLRNTKSTSNNELILKSQINDLQYQLRYKSTLKLAKLRKVRSDQLSIFPEIKGKHEIGIVTSDCNLEMQAIIDERNNLQRTVSQLVQQMENLKRFDMMMERQLPTRHDTCPGDCATQMIQTIPYHPVDVELTKEVEHLKDKLSKYEIKNLEFDRLCLRISELQLVEIEHRDLKIEHNKQYLEHKTTTSQHLAKINELNAEIDSLRTNLERYQNYEDENNILAERCKNLQNIIESQQGNVRFLENCKSLVVSSESKINALKEELDQKCSIIKVSEDKLLTLQTQLRESINTLTTETTSLKSALQEAHDQIVDLETKENQNDSLIKELRQEIIAKDVVLKEYEVEQAQTSSKSKNIPKMLQERDNVIKQLRLNLLDMRADNEKLNDMSVLLQGYIMNRKASSSSVCCGYVSCTSNTRIHNSSKVIENIFQALRQLDVDLNKAMTNCDKAEFHKLQTRYNELQSLAKGQVHWLAAELRKCKNQVQQLQCHFKEKQ